MQVSLRVARKMMMICDSDTGEAYSDNRHYIAEANKSCIRQNLPLNIVSQPFKFFLGTIKFTIECVLLSRTLFVNEYF